MKIIKAKCQSKLAEQSKSKTIFSSKKEYESQLLEAQGNLLSLQQEVFRKKEKIVIILEGADTAGKGGLVRRMAQHLDPRIFHVHAISKPTDEELRQYYLQRFFLRLPRSGEICVFDRS